jgi:cellulose 1,4-beta-cellobiosidase
MKIIKNIIFLLNLPIIMGNNPFDPIDKIYINSDLVKNIEKTQDLIKNYTDKNLNYFNVDSNDLLIAKENMEVLKTIPSAFWIDKESKIEKVKVSLNEIVNSNGKYDTIVLIVYDLPNRDCAALASNGELCCNLNEECLNTCTQNCQLLSESCEIGLSHYRENYIDELYNVLNDDLYQNIKKILIIEPDSLPNIPTNRGFYGCSDVTTDSYLTGIQYTINKLSKISNHYIYLDIGHEGWLGWCNNLYSNEYNFINFVLKTLEDQIQYIRGFASNVANYQNLGKACKYPFQKVSEITDYCSYYNQYLVGYCKNAPTLECCYDPCGNLDLYNPANNELNYVQLFRHSIEYSIYHNLIPKFNTPDGLPTFIIDTSRNGPKNSFITIDDKSECSSWCNVKGGKIGLHPTINTALPYIDAYFWLKTPGESDGCIDSIAQGKCIPGNYKCSRYDANCGTHKDNIGYLDTEPCPPEAGDWFDYQFIHLNL